MSVRLIESLSTTEALAEVFSDLSVLQAMLDFEVALARSEAELKIIPRPAASTIARFARVENFDVAALARETLRAGTPGIPLVKMLRKKVQQKEAAAADFVHWGATSQDVSDTALVLLLKKSSTILTADLDRLENALQGLVTRHKGTVMLGRTLLQPAPPITFGLKAAGWYGAIRRGHDHLEAAFADALVLQLGGASGSLAALGSRGISVGKRVAEHLGLNYPDAPWHTHRDRLAAVVCACGILVGSIGKMARDVSLLMQAEVGEASEPGGAGRGGSSTMPQKRNPIACAIALAAADRVPGLVAAFLSQMVQEHERAVGSQAEWTTVAAVVQSTGVAIASMAEAAEKLVVNPKRMRENLEATRGAVYSEKAALLLTEKMGREGAHQLLQKTTTPRQLRKQTLSETLAQLTEVQNGLLDQEALTSLEDPEDYLGMAREFAERLCRPSKKRRRGKG